MIQLYTWSTPNGRKVSILLEELGIPYNVNEIDITSGDQFNPSFLSISPNNKIPAIVDEENDQAIFESGAILIYLAEKTGKFLPSGSKEKWEVVQWLMWQMGGQGPMLGQAHHFLKYNPGKSEYAEQRYHQEAKRLYKVLNTRLEGRSYVAANQLTIADIAIWPWVSRFRYHQVDLHAYPNVLRWYLQLAERKAFQAGYKVPHEESVPFP